MTIGRKLQRKNLTRQGMIQILDRLRDKDQALAEVRSEIANQIENREAKLQNAVEKASIINRAKEECSRVEVLHQLINASRMRGANETFRERCKDRYVKLMKRNVENRISRGVGYRLSITEIEGSIQKLRDKLLDEYQVPLPNYLLEGWAPEEIRANGIFGSGIWFGAWPHLREERTRSDPSVTMTTDSDGKTVIYMRSEHATIERR